MSLWQGLAHFGIEPQLLTSILTSLWPMLVTLPIYHFTYNSLISSVVFALCLFCVWAGIFSFYLFFSLDSSLSSLEQVGVIVRSPHKRWPYWWTSQHPPSQAKLTALPFVSGSIHNVLVLRAQDTSCLPLDFRKLVGNILLYFSVLPLQRQTNFNGNNLPAVCQTQRSTQCGSLWKTHACVWCCVIISSELKNVLQEGEGGLWDSGRKHLTNHRKFLKPRDSQGPSPKLGKRQQLLGRRTAAKVPGGNSVMCWVACKSFKKLHSGWLFINAAVLESYLCSCMWPW